MLWMRQRVTDAFLPLPANTAANVVGKEPAGYLVAGGGRGCWHAVHASSANRCARHRVCTEQSPQVAGAS
jgi:hypothetical protein